MRKCISFFLMMLISFFTVAQETAPLWKDFVQARKNGTTPILPDFSYAGYYFSEKEIPSVAGKKFFNVKDFGAIPGDAEFDDAAIQKTIDAAEKNPGGGVVFFPAGKFLIAPDNDSLKTIRVSKSNIVLKGSGSGNGGTEIYQANMRINGRQIIFKPVNSDGKKLTVITKSATRESFTIEVEDASKLQVGQDIVIRHRSEEFTRSYFAPLPLKPVWTRLFGEKGGMQINEIHTIEKIQGNTVTLKNPLHLDIVMVKTAAWDIYCFNYIEECGVEDILFASNWKTYPEEFIHHKNAIHDYAYEALGMEYIKNSWVRNCVFQDWNEGIFIRSGYQVSVLNTDFKGKKGHASVHARAGYGVLIKNCHFNNAQHHGAGTGYSAVGTVITQCTLGTDQNFDIHSGQPYATLYDNIDGGVFYNLGGPEPGHPHHGKDLVLWNFFHRSEKEQHYNFWDMDKRRNYTIAKPILAGFQSNKKVEFENAGIVELQGKKVLPQSLFEAQLILRLQKKDKTGNIVTPQPSNYVGTAQSQWVYPDSKGKLIYKTLEGGDRIMDFSYAGYMGGGVSIPDVPVMITLGPSQGDNSDKIQNAIDEISKMRIVNGSRGAVLLKPGTYDCENPLTLNTSGVVLRGSGSGANGTILNLTGKPHACITIKGNLSSKIVGGSTTIADSYVPSGKNSFTLTNASGFTVGDTIRITRPITDAWIQFMGMDQLVRSGKKQTWISGDISTERVIRKIEKNKITLDVPLNDSYDAKYIGLPGVTVQKISTTGELAQIGIEGFRIVAPAQSVTISEGHHRAFTMSGIRDGWARNIEIFNTVNSVSVTGKLITIDNISIIHDVPTLGAAKPADLNGSGQQLLFNRCRITGDNLFFFGTGAKVTGPVVLLNCVFRGNGWIQPHQRWATGLLIDRCEVPDGGIDFMNRGVMGSGHGWAIGWAVAWNSKARSYLNQMPPGSANWVIGSYGERQRKAIPGSNESGSITYDSLKMLPEGIYDSHGVPVAPSSLYLAQLLERLGQQALKNTGYDNYK